MTITKAGIIWILGMIFCFFFPFTNYAATNLTFSWVPNTDSTSEYWLLMDGTELVATIPDQTTASYTYTLEDDVTPHTFLLIAATDTDFSLPSATAVWIPKRPGYPQKFIVTFEPAL